MTTKQVTPPAELAVSLDLAKENLRIEGDDLDASLSMWIAAITAEAEHVCNRVFIHQEWEVTLDAFPDAIRLDRPPTAAVLSLCFYDTDNILQTLDPADYYLDNVSEPGYVVPAPDKAWPSTYDKPNAIKVRYRCGFGPTEASVPPNIKQYIMARLCLMYDPPPSGAEAVAENLSHLLDASRVYG